MELPKELFEMYRQGILSREDFIKAFEKWQKGSDIDPYVKGGADENGVYLQYRYYKIYYDEKEKLFKGYFGCPVRIKTRDKERQKTAKEVVDEFVQIVLDLQTDTTGDCPEGRLVHCYPNTEYFDCLSPREQSQMLNH